MYDMLNPNLTVLDLSYINLIFVHMNEFKVNKVQSNLSIASTEGTGQKWPLYTGGCYMEVGRYRQVW